MEKYLELKKLLDGFRCKLDEIKETFTYEENEGTIKDQIENHVLVHIELVQKETSELYYLDQDILSSYDDREIKENFIAHKIKCDE